MGKVKVDNGYCERINDPLVQGILKKRFPVKIGYWIVRSIDKIRQASRAYFVEKEKLMKRHEDTKKRDAEKKKGDCPPFTIMGENS